MPRKRRRTKIPTPAWEPPRGALGRRVMGRNPRFYAAAGIVFLVLVALGIVAFAYGSDYWADRQRPGSTALQVDDTKYTLQYFTDRLRMFVQQVGGIGSQSAQPQVAIPSVADQLVDEALLLRFAAEQGVSASEDDIRGEIASRLGTTADDPDFDVRFQAELSRSGLTEEEYRQMIEATVLRDKIREKLEVDVPATAESIHYRQILVGDQAAADEIVGQVEGGADFGEVAAQRSLDATTKDNGGDAGWVPRGVLPASLEDALFALEEGGLTTFPIGSGALVFQVLEKAEDREIEPDMRSAIAGQAVQDWLDEKRRAVNVVNDMDLTSGNAEKIDWAVRRMYST